LFNLLIIASAVYKINIFTITYWSLVVVNLFKAFFEIK